MHVEKEASPPVHAVQRLLSPFVSRYVRRQLQSPDQDKWGRIRGCLESGRAFGEEAFLAVVMIDISGYSKLTSELSTLGKLASEVITKSLGQYLDKVIHVVGQFNGDVIKFLGDALLISFEANPETYNQSDSQANVVLTALHFLVTVMTSLPTAVFDLNSFSDAALALGSSTENTRVLRLHSAVWCGRATHVIAGLAGERLDYFIAGEFAGAIEAALNLAKRDEIGLSPMVATVVEEALGMNLNHAKSSGYVTLDPRAISTLYHLLGTLRRHSISSSNPIAVSSFLPTLVHASPHIEERWQRDVETFRLFVNDAMVHKIKSVATTVAQPSGNVSNGLDVGDYRTVVVVFVKLLESAFALDAVQDALVAFLHSVRRFRGVFQQVAVDDKGTTLLAAFGLPPFTQDANALNAIHSLMAFSEMGQESKFGHFVAGVSSGDLLFTRIGNDYRSEASFVGDAICTAARLMTFSTQSNVVVFDNSIKPFLPTRYPIESLGGVKLKGKACEIELFQIRLSGRDPNIKSTPFWGGNPYGLFAGGSKANLGEGYEPEKEKLREAIVDWLDWHKCGGKESRRPAVACAILGPMGSGKSSFLESAVSLLRERKAEVCFTFGTELRHLTPLYALKNILKFIYETFSRKSSDQTSGLLPVPESNVLRRQISRQSSGLLNRSEQGELFQRFMLKYELNPEIAPMLKFLLGYETTEKAARTLGVENTFVIHRDAIKVVMVAIVSKFTLSKPTCLVIEDMQVRYLYRSIAKNQELYERCEGMPLKASLMVQAIVQSKEVFGVKDGRLITIGTTETIDRLFSASVGTFILAEFDRLQSDCKEVLKKASVLGTQFFADQIQGLDPNLDSETLESLLRAARDANFLKEEFGVEGEEEYTFRHVSLRNAIYESVPFTVRQRLHLLAADFFERQCNDSNKRNIWPVICYHLNQAKEFEKSLSKMFARAPSVTQLLKFKI
ncbi:hypothetical protein HDU96_005150 [Phlyctochytrium bullatum]|nr:hypothetical protein HDU96_005150 [Phlyctochytrium bullatum]